MAENDFDKTEAPTPRRRQEARQEGNIPRSQDLSAAVTLLGGVIVLHMLGMRLLGGMKTTMELSLSGAHASNPTRPDDILALGGFAVRTMATTALPLLLCLMAAALLVAVGQVGFVISAKPVTPNFNKLNPLKGAQNMLGPRGWVRLAMSFLKLLLLAAVAGFVVVTDLEAIIHIGELQIGPAFVAACHLVFALSLKLAAVLLVLAILDYSYQRFQHEKDLRMSKHEVKEEMKRMEGDPMIKQRRARVARQLAQQRMAQAVPGADVVVTNPTHFSVALKYDSAEMRAPRVVAKGADYMALRIRQIAQANGVPLVERKPLARALYAGVDVGQEVPPEHYAAVAEILAYVYRL
ncbi:MAG: flagellar biosynthesis protein FlhB, partial [Phycisphaeraceae bacterium]